MIWMVLLMTVMKFQEFQFDLKLQADLIWTSSDLRQLSIWFVKSPLLQNDDDGENNYQSSMIMTMMTHIKKTLSKNMKTSQKLRKLPVTSYRESQI